MSKAGVLSHQGDDYQVKIASKWITHLLFNDCIASIQVESTGLRGDDVSPFVDDIVVEFTDGHRVYIQVKKNEPRYQNWTLKNPTMERELIKARDQLEMEGTHQRTKVLFYSQSPFGKIRSLAKEVDVYVDFKLFESEAPPYLKFELDNLAGLWDRTQEKAYALLKNLDFITTSDFEELDRDLRSLLSSRFECPEEVRRDLENIIRGHQSRLGSSPDVLDKSFIESQLQKLGHIPSPKWSVTELLDSFRECSGIGRSRIRDIKGHRIDRSETAQVLSAIEDGIRTVIIKGGPGIGKTCILLDVADKLEEKEEQDKAVLFVKGDQFVGARSYPELVGYGLPDNIVERCAQLADNRQVVVLVDSLDTLSLQKAHGSFQLFLNLLDRLATVQNVTIITTCRSFDLEYDPKLRGREWGKIVTVKPLRVKPDLVDILSEWDIEYANLSTSLQENLRIPGHLWIFAQLLDEQGIDLANSIYELHLRFFQRICDEPEWGKKAWAVITHIANWLRERRKLQIAKLVLNVSPDLLQFLLSQQVLIESGSSYSFGHQEFLDIVLVREALQNDRRMVNFVLSQPALPFIRPTIRVYLHVLRATDQVDFRRQVRELLDNDCVVYHLKRLVVESLVEIQPVREDLSLFGYIVQEHESLFVRFIGRAYSDAWVDTFVRLFSVVSSNETTRHLAGRILRHLLRWVVNHPEIVLSTWKKAVEGQEVHDVDTRRIIANGVYRYLQVSNSADLSTNVVASLIRLFLDDTPLIRNAAFAVGPIIRVWVDSRQCDDLLLSYLGLDTPDVPTDFDQRVRSLITEETANESPKKFLSSRMSASDLLINAVMEKVPHQSVTRRQQYVFNLIQHTSWIERHSERLEPENILIQAFEDALLERASREDTWWQEHETYFRTHEDEGMRYLAISVYFRYPEIHCKGISILLTDPDTYKFARLKSEVRELANAAYPYLSKVVSKEHQSLLLDWSKGDENSAIDELKFDRLRTYQNIIWIPKPYLTEESTQFLETYGKQFGPWRPTPNIYGSGGFIPDPISPTELQKMGDTGILKLIVFYGTKVNWQSWGTSREGGWQELQSVLRIAAMNNPSRAIQWINILTEEGVERPYIDACIEGISRHVLALSGTLKSNGSWNPTEPLSDGVMLGRQLIQLVDLPTAVGVRGDVQAIALWACSCVLNDDESTDRLTFLLKRLSQSRDPDGSLNVDPLNSVCGMVAQGAIKLACQLAEKGHRLRGPLERLLRQLIQDDRSGVRLSILYDLPALTQSAPDLAWSLLNDVVAIAGRHEWEQIEQCLYYNYHDRFDLIESILNQLKMSALDIAGDTYGRIATLSMLSNHLRWDSVFSVVIKSPPTVWDGVFEVLTANLIHDRIHSVCESRLVQLLNEPNLSKSSLKSVMYAVTHPETKPYLTKAVIKTLIIQAIEHRCSDISLESIFECAARHVEDNPHIFLDLLEQVVSGFEDKFIRLPYDSRSLVSLLISMLREADESDNPDMIQRTVRLHDRLLKLGVTKVDQMLDEASRT